jgi:parallel beta-helix repeat protein
MSNGRSKRKKLLIGLFIFTTLLLVAIFGGTYYLFFRKDYNWHQDFELDLEYNGKTIIVDANGTGQTDDLEVGISLASDGDIVKVLPGVYNGYFLIDKEIKVLGEGPGVILIPVSDNYAIKVHEDVEGVTIQGLEFERNGMFVCESGITMGSENNLVRDCRFSGNFTTGVYVQDGEYCLIDQCEFDLLDQYGVSISSSEYILVENCVFRDLSVGYHTQDGLRTACVNNEFHGCINSVFIEDGTYNVVRNNEYRKTERNDILDTGWRTKIDEGSDVKVSEDVSRGHSGPIPWAFICVPAFSLFMIIVAIIVIDMVFVTKWLISWIADKNREEKEYLEKERERTLIKRALAGKDIRKPKFEFMRYLVRYPVILFNIFMFTLCFTITLGAIFFVLVADFEGEKYLCCLFPLFPLPVLGVIFFGVLSIGSFFSIKKKKKVE